MKLDFRDGLLFTSLQITFKGCSKIIDNIVVDTGAAESIISPDIVENIGIEARYSDSVSSFYSVGGSLHNFFVKKVESIEFGNFKINNTKIDFGVIDPKGHINGLLGLDLLIISGASIDLRNLTLDVI